MNPLTVVFREIPYSNINIYQEIIHEVIVDGYRERTSLDCFTNGKRKGKITKEELRQYKDRCCWSPKCLYYMQHKYEWISQETARLQKFNKLTNNSYIHVTYGYDVETIEEIPTIKYANLKEFYKTIGFNHKKRRYENSIS